MSYEIPIPHGDKPNNNKPEEENPKLSRRDFLALSVKALATGVAVAAGVNVFENSKDNQKNKTAAGEELEEKNTDQTKEDITQETQEDIQQEETDVLGETFREQLEKGQHITLNETTREAIFNNWHKKYSPGTVNYEKGIVEGLGKMHSWLEDIKKVFQENNVPEKFIYLAIAESHFKSSDISGKGAVGVYQITKETAGLERFKMIVNDDYDERLDPVRSAELCATHLRYSYEKLGKNWDLALLAYNGSFTNSFLEYLPQEELAMPLEKIHAQGNYTLGNETLSEVAEKFGTSLPLLSRLNPLPVESYSEWYEECRNIRPGKKLVIPQKREIKEEAFYQWMEKEINSKIKENLSNGFYKTREGDTLENLTRLLHIDPASKLLESINDNIKFKPLCPGAKEKELVSGQTINVPQKNKTSVDYLLHILSEYQENINYPGKLYAILKIIKENKLKSEKGKFQLDFSKTRVNRDITLLEIAKIKKISPENLILVNPAIKNPSADLKKGLEFRLPTSFHIQKDKNKIKKDI